MITWESPDGEYLYHLEFKYTPVTVSYYEKGKLKQRVVTQTFAAIWWSQGKWNSPLVETSARPNYKDHPSLEEARRACIRKLTEGANRYWSSTYKAALWKAYLTSNESRHAPGEAGRKSRKERRKERAERKANAAAAPPAADC